MSELPIIFKLLFNNTMVHLCNKYIYRMYIFYSTKYTKHRVMKFWLQKHCIGIVFVIGIMSTTCLLWVLRGVNDMLNMSDTADKAFPHSHSEGLNYWARIVSEHIVFSVTTQTKCSAGGGLANVVPRCEEFSGKCSYSQTFCVGEF